MYGEVRARLIRKFLYDPQASPIERSCPYVTRHNDVIICGYFRSGTSWVQQILHQIRCGGGDETYTDIDQAVWYIPPYMERLDFNLNADQGTSIRLFRCNDCYEDAPTHITNQNISPKYVILVRDPVDVAWSEAKSRYRNLGIDKDYDFTAVTELYSSMTSMNNTDKYQSTKPIYYPTYWEHFLSWWPNRNKHNIFWLHYEDLLKDLPLCISELSRFMAIDLTDDQLRNITEYCTYEYMRENADKFSGEYLIKLRSKMLAVDPWRPLIGRVSRTDGAQNGLGSMNLNEKTKATIRWNWTHSIEKLTGFRSYSLLYATNSLHGRVNEQEDDEDEEHTRQRKNTLNLL